MSAVHQYPGTESRSPDGLARDSAPLAIHAISSDPQTVPLLFSATAALAQGLEIKVFLLFLEVVPYPRPLSDPPVRMKVLEAHLSSVAEFAGVETSIGIFLCRDRNQTIRQQLPRESVVVVAKPPSWWRDPWRSVSERFLIRKLRADGHRVIVIDSTFTNHINQLESVLKVSLYGDIHSVKLGRDH